MCDGMKIGKRLILIGVILIVLSMTMATQYATTEIGYSYSIVHPSDSDIRFIGSDNSSGGGRILRVPDNTSTNADLQLVFGNFTAGQNKTYTCAFGIVNEEAYAVEITHMKVVTSSGSDYMQIWLHGDRDAHCDGDDASSVFMWNQGSAAGGHSDNSSAAWTLAAGNQDPDDMDGSNVNTPWDSSASVRYSIDDTDAVSTVDDYVWVQVSIDAPTNADVTASYTGTVYIYTKATTTT